jgi:Family of unknown function (DUF6350)
MVARAFGVCLRQALRSVALTLFPLAFIALFAWATAGSTSGNTSDPMRATGWLWLAAHCVPFYTHSQVGLSSSAQLGKLSILPLSALLFPGWAIRRTFPRVREVLPRGFGVQIIFSLCYAAIAFLIALASYSHQVSASLYLAPIFSFLLALIATTKISESSMIYLKFSLYGLLTLLGISALGFSVSLAAHWSIVKSIDTVITPGIVGGFLYALIQLLYLPNIALAALGYFGGAGFTFGAHTNIAPTHFILHGISAIPALGALPTGKHPLLQYGEVIWPLLIILTLVLINRSVFRFGQRQVEAIVSSALFVVFLAGLGYMASGELLTPSLNRVGVQWARLTVIAAVSAGCALVIGIYLPELVKKLLHKRRSANV